MMDNNVKLFRVVVVFNGGETIEERYEDYASANYYYHNHLNESENTYDPKVRVLFACMIRDKFEQESGEICQDYYAKYEAIKNLIAVQG